jgi:hypothetical protein
MFSKAWNTEDFVRFSLALVLLALDFFYEKSNGSVYLGAERYSAC